MTTILVVDDDRSLTRALSKALRAHGYEVVTASSGAEAIARASRTYPELLLVDLGLPEGTSVEVITAIRGWSGAPIVALATREHQSVKVRALEAGADDVLAKPFGIDELLLRITGALRRGAAGGEGGVLVAGELVIDFGARHVERNGVLVDLTAKEWSVLVLLVRQGGVLSVRSVLDQLWGPGYHEELAYVDDLVERVRDKLGDGETPSTHIVVESDGGYRFDKSTLE